MYVKNKKLVVDIVDSIEYTTTNCFAHQLYDQLQELNNFSSDIFIKTVPFSKLHFETNADLYISRLKQRSLLSKISNIKQAIGNSPIVIYDQDPWEAFRDDSLYKGTYEIVLSKLNVQYFAVTTNWWANFLNKKGIPAKFVKMGVLQKYCDLGKSTIDRSTKAGFIGSLHGYRNQLFHELKILGCNVGVRRGDLSYIDYLKNLSEIGFFIHREDYSFTVDGEQVNLDVGLWVKDIEAIARGCFSIRNKGSDVLSYLEGIDSILLYENISDIPDIINKTLKIDNEELNVRRESALKKIYEENNWAATARELLECVL